jgi:hypothetical protein
METTLKSTVAINTKGIAKNNAHSLSKFWENAEFNRFGIIAIQLFVMGCISGLAAAFGAQGDIIKLSFVAFPTIISLAATLAVSPMKAIIYLTSFAILCDLVVLAV